MSNLSAEYSSLDLEHSSNLFTELSEIEQESVSGGLFIYYNQTQINSSANNTSNFTGTLGVDGSNGGGASASGTFSNSGASNYQLTSTTLILGGISDQMLFYMLPGLLNFLSLTGM